MALTRVRHLLEMIRFSHTLFALPFALLAAVMAWAENARDTPAIAWRWQDLLGILLCMVTARSAAMAFNRLADWRIDAQNPRTAGRHIPAGMLSAGAVALFAVACSLGFVAATLLFLPNSLAAVSGRAGAGFFAWLQLYEAVHLAGPFLARRGTDAGPDLRLDRHSRANR